jgi:hypothetical protein
MTFEETQALLEELERLPLDERVERLEALERDLRDVLDEAARG